MKCEHQLHDMEAACADGACPLCLQIRVNQLQGGTERYWEARWREQEGVLDRADAHTKMLMESIASLEARLKAAEYAARVNWDGWQQELARKGARSVSNGHQPPQGER